MRWLKHVISLLLAAAAVVIALATVFSDHSGDYGKVFLPHGGTVHLPKGTVTVYFRLRGSASDAAEKTGFSFQVTPAKGGEPLPLGSPSQTSDYGLVRSQTIGDLGAVAKIKVPSEGSYVVSGSSSAAAGSSYLEFGTNAATAALHRWKLLAGLVLGAVLLALIPLPRGSRRREEPAGEPVGWSSDPRAPYAG
jgi:hypothetical protein